MNRLSKRHFWDWFRRHHTEYLVLHTRSKKEAGYWLSEMEAHLRVYSRCFGFTLLVQHGQAATLTITVNGRARYFKRVDTFVAMAPVIPGWQIKALEDSMPVDFQLEKQITNTGVDPHELYFSFASDDPDNTHIIVYHPLCTRDNEDLFLELAREAIYNLLGERSFGMDIHYVTVTNLSYSDTNDVQKMEELPECIGLRRSSLAIGHDGRLLNI